MKSKLFAAATLTVFLCSAIVTGQTARPATTPAKPAVKHPLDKGDFKVGFSPKMKSKNPKKDMPKDEKATFQEIATELNTFLALPR
ncbi:MAG: hypothetical protein ABL959_19035, partial [Pyrinomonadaceae bacterium]